METQTYIILSMIGRYILIALCFMVFIQIILEIRKAKLNNDALDLASLEWKKKRIIFELGQENIVGRSRSCDVVVSSRSVKWRHFRLYEDCGEWIVAPIRKAEVYINNYLVEKKCEIRENDIISIENVDLVFSINDASDQVDEETDE